MKGGLIQNMWYEVKPRDIKEDLFLEPRKDPDQEKLRKNILDDALRWRKKYSRNFKIMAPKITWPKIDDIFELNDMTYELGGHHIAHRIELYLLLAQRIQNGESWESCLQQPEDYFILVIWIESRLEPYDPPLKKIHYGHYRPPKDYEPRLIEVPPLIRLFGPTSEKIFFYANEFYLHSYARTIPLDMFTPLIVSYDCEQ